MTSSAKKTANEFRKKYRITEITVDSLKSIISEQGYTIVEFNTVINSPSVSALISALKVESFIAKSKGFTYVDDKYRIVFLNESLNEEEKLIVLSHEEAHIFCGHFSAGNIIGNDVIQEAEANEFTHYILYPTLLLRCKVWIGKHKRISVAVAAIMIFAVVGLSIFGAASKHKSYFGEYYVTEAGSKYHRENCIFIKNKTNVRRLTKEEFESGEYEPCKACQPDE